MVGLLLAATAISIAVGDTVEGVAIAAIVVLNGVLGFWQEGKAEQAVRALSHAFTQSAVVVRGGEEATRPAEDVVPGDLIVVGEGDRVAADVRVTETWSLEANESALTGESLPALVAIGLALIPVVLFDAGKLLRSRRAAAAPQSG